MTEDASAKVSSASGPKALAITALVVVLGVALLQFVAGGLVGTIDDQLYDYASRYQGQKQSVGDAPYILVEIDDRSIEALGRYPWPRGRFADLLRLTQDGGADVVGLNIIFAEAADPAGDSALAQAIADAGNVVLASTVVFAPTVGSAPDASFNARLRIAASIIEPLPELAAGAAGVGNIAVVEDGDGSLRRYPPAIIQDGAVYPSLAQAMAGSSAQSTLAGEHIDDDGTLLINYGAMSPAAVARISFSDVLDLDADDARRLFEGKTVMVATTYSGGVASAPTPLSVRTPSAYVHLFALNTLRSGSYLQTVPTWALFLLGLILIAILGALVPERAPVKLVGGAAALIAILTGGSLVAFFMGSLFIAPGFPALATVAFVAGRGVEQWWSTNRDLRKSNEELQESLDTLRRTRSAKEKIEAELNVARDIQFSMLPLVFPPFPERTEFSLHATLEPALQIGGDFYDYFLTDEDHLYICVADVSGKGVPAALFMAVSKALLKSRAAHEPSPANIMTHVNEELAIDNESGMFVTVWIAIVDLRTGGFTYTNAGHNPPYLYKANRELVRLDELHGPIAAAVDGLDYGEGQGQMEKGDMLLLYTDGVPEAMDPDGELYEEDRMIEIIEGAPPSTVKEMVDITAEGVWAFQSTAPQADDVTVVALQYHGASDGSD